MYRFIYQANGTCGNIIGIRKQSLAIHCFSFMLWDSEHFLVQVVFVFTPPTSKKEVKNAYRLEGQSQPPKPFLRNQTQTQFVYKVIFIGIYKCYFCLLKQILYVHVHISFIWYLFLKTHFNNRNPFLRVFQKPCVPFLDVWNSQLQKTQNPRCGTIPTIWAPEPRAMGYVGWYRVPRSPTWAPYMGKFLYRIAQKISRGSILLGYKCPES